MSVNYGEQIRRRAVQNPDQVAVIDGDLEFTYAQLNEQANRIANGLRDAGIRRGDRVGVLMDNSYRPIEIMAACTKAGFIYVPLDFRLSAADIESIFRDCAPTAVIVQSGYLDVAAQIRSHLPSVVLWLTEVTPAPVGYGNYDELVERGSAADPGVDVDDSELLCIIYTSGTTGKAKGVTLSHVQCLDNAMSVILGAGIDADTRYIVSYPHNSTGTVNHVWGPVIMMGGTIVMTDVKQFSGDKFFATVDRRRVTHCQLVPTMLFRLLDHPHREDFDLSSLRCIGYASAPIPPERVRQVLETFGPILVQMFGMTETTSHATILSKADHIRAASGEPHLFASCGRPALGVELRLVDDEGKDVPVGEVGEIALRGRWITTHYWNDPVRTAETIRDGWLYSGDLARMDAEEYLYIVDRKKDLIITGGANVASTEVEAVIYSHPAILEVAVIGVPDPEWGERIHAIVACKPGQRVTAEELIAHCRERLAHFKCPKSADIRAELPRTSTGKLAKSELRQESWAR